MAGKRVDIALLYNLLFAGFVWFLRCGMRRNGVVSNGESNQKGMERKGMEWNGMEWGVASLLLLVLLAWRSSCV
jgi:hypothetical protein